MTKLYPNIYIHHDKIPMPLLLCIYISVYVFDVLGERMICGIMGNVSEFLLLYSIYFSCKLECVMSKCLLV